MELDVSAPVTKDGQISQGIRSDSMDDGTAHFGNLTGPTTSPSLILSREQFTDCSIKTGARYIDRNSFKSLENELKACGIAVDAVQDVNFAEDGSSVSILAAKKKTILGGLPALFGEPPFERQFLLIDVPAGDLAKAHVIKQWSSRPGHAPSVSAVALDGQTAVGTQDEDFDDVRQIAIYSAGNDPRKLKRNFSCDIQEVLGYSDLGSIVRMKMSPDGKFIFIFDNLSDIECIKISDKHATKVDVETTTTEHKLTWGSKPFFYPGYIELSTDCQYLRLKPSSRYESNFGGLGRIRSGPIAAGESREFKVIIGSDKLTLEPIANA